MNNIEFKDGAVCFANGKQWFYAGESTFGDLASEQESYLDFDEILEPFDNDFQLNTIKQGDYIAKSEIDTEQKYNDAVEVFGLFGFFRVGGYSSFILDIHTVMVVNRHSKFVAHIESDKTKIKLTYPQLMAIGELKRLEVERDKKEARMGFVDSLGEVVTHAERLEYEWTDKHYDNFYQLTENDIKAGKVKIDAYFVNRMWKINQWDDTGAGFHVLKTLPRIANNKNPLKRELVALKRQVDLLCKMHGVDGGDFK